MKNKTLMKIISGCFIFMMIFNCTSSVYAAINESYGDPASVYETDLEAKLTGSSILEAIARLVYGLGSLVENLVGAAFQKLTGTNMFPWADRVIFNTVPFLDVNFLNPSISSLFKTDLGADTALANIVKNTYYTVLILCIGFLGIVVGVMAVRLAVSTIAAEKARYKEAIVKFLFSLMILFCVHYLLAFVFYINESMVEIASSLLSENLKDVTIASDFFTSNTNDDVLVEQFFEKQDNKVTNLDSLKDEILSDSQKKTVAAILIKNADYKKYVIPDAYGNNETEVGGFWSAFSNSLPWNLWEGKEAAERLVADVNTALDLSKVKELQDFVKKYKNNVTKMEAYEKSIEDAKMTWASTSPTKSDSAWKSSSEYKEAQKKATESANGTIRAYETIISASQKIGTISGGGNASSGGEVGSKDIIQQMGQYFKDSAWTYETDEDGNIDGWSATELSLQGALLYAIFVVQSMLFFVAYIKRFFFVVILALLAPVVVIYDFLGSAI